MTNTTVFVQPGGGFERISIGRSGITAPAKGEITVRLRASSLNFHDYLIVSGKVPVPTTRIPMADGAGEVTAVGDGVGEFAVGDAVVSTFFPKWQDGRPTEEGFSSVPGDGVDGYARQEVTATASSFTLAPKGWSHAEAATITTAGLTAWRVMVEEARIKAGDTVLVQGTGGVSVYALQLAKMMGATVIATSSSDAKLERVKALGADHVINYRTTPEWSKTARALTGGRGVDLVLEVAGAATLRQSMHATRVGGHVGLIGILTGITAELTLRHALYRQLRLQGVLVGNRRQQQDMVRAMEASGMHPVLDRHFDLEAIVDAFRYQESGRHFGKIILDIP